MGQQLQADDEGPHPVGPEPNWNESRYVDMFDARQEIGTWMRLGNRPNEGLAEVSVAVSLPDGRIAFSFQRAPLTVNGLTAGGQSWSIDEPFVSGRVCYEGEVRLLADAWDLGEPRRALAEAPRLACTIDLVSTGEGLCSVLGADQDHIRRIFLPGQAAWHYQHLVRTTGTIRVGEDEWHVDGRGGRDHSWGPRNWHAKTWFRWLVAGVSDDLGFMLTRAVGSTGQTRGGFVWDGGVLHLVDDFALRSTYGGAPHDEVRAVEVNVRSGEREWRAAATPRSWLPLRHRQAGPDGAQSVLRIVKSPCTWLLEGEEGEGMLEYHDLMVGGRPAGLVD